MHYAEVSRRAVGNHTWAEPQPSWTNRWHWDQISPPRTIQQGWMPRSVGPRPVEKQAAPPDLNQLIYSHFAPPRKLLPCPPLENTQKERSSRLVILGGHRHICQIYYSLQWMTMKVTWRSRLRDTSNPLINLNLKEVLNIWFCRYIALK